MDEVIILKLEDIKKDSKKDLKKETKEDNKSTSNNVKLTLLTLRTLLND